MVSLELVISLRSQGQALGVLISRSVGFWRHKGGENVSCSLLRMSSLRGSFMGSAILMLGEGEGAPAAAGGHSTETSCLHILLPRVWWGEDGRLWQQGTQRQTVCTTLKSL